MRIEVRLFAVLRERAGSDRVLVELPEGSTIADLKRVVSEACPELGSLAHVAGVVGSDYARDDHVIAADDALALLPPVSGGLPEGEEETAPLDDYEQGVFELSAEPIDVAAQSRRVVSPTCGALVTFTGLTRCHNRGQVVERLDYEAFTSMAGPEMARIFALCRERVEKDPDGPLRMLCIHRTETVEVGEPSVLVAVASPHRAAAFEAARFLIDTLKERLPVWKKEVYADGHHWIGDRS